ncbi:hypothetical protein AB0G15_16955 [Streptosporangium sp. NPDC023825]|uniref:hypothetical protein n=1 Tax=Streptosporangium sp. NPDC023825 TaxID=3154909 RepID=UPI00341ED9F4
MTTGSFRFKGIRWRPSELTARWRAWLSPDRFGDSSRWPMTWAEHMAADADGTAARWTTPLSTAVGHVPVAAIFDVGTPRASFPGIGEETATFRESVRRR